MTVHHSSIPSIPVKSVCSRHTKVVCPKRGHRRSNFRIYSLLPKCPEDGTLSISEEEKIHIPDAIATADWKFSLTISETEDSKIDDPINEPRPPMQVPCWAHLEHYRNPLLSVSDKSPKGRLGSLEMQLTQMSL